MPVVFFFLKKGNRFTNPPPVVVC